MNPHQSLALRRPLLLLLLALTLPLCAAAQPLLKFHVADFGQDQFDLLARTAPTAQKDGDGNLYAIIKVYPTNPDDRLQDYRFNFGLLDSKAEMHDGGVLWLYVQKGAKSVSISREGYARVDRYSLGGSLQPGGNYVMRLSSQARPVERQMLQFVTEPPVPGAVILLKSQAEGAVEEPFGTTDEEGSYANSLPFGTYTYRIVASDHDLLEGYVTLSDRQVHIEKVTLKPHYVQATLNPGMDCQILINDKPYTTTGGVWTGHLKYGKYYVVCRKPGHLDTSAYIEATPDGPTTFMLESPIPVTGTVAINSKPTGAKITIDDKDYGLTPKVVDLVVGTHHLQLSKPGMATYHNDITVTEGSYAELNTSLDDSKIVNIASKPTDAEITINGRDYGHTPISGMFEKGKYRIHMVKDGYIDFDEKVTLNPAKPDVTLRMEKRRSSHVYARLGFQAGMAMGPSVAFGIDLRRVNFELSCLYTLPATVYLWNCDYNTGISETPTKKTVNAITMGFRFGYIIPVGRRFTITPRIGYNQSVTQYLEGPLQMDFGSIAADVRLTYKINPCITLVATPQYHHKVYSDLDFDPLFSINKIKNWATGADITIGVAFNF